MYPQVYIYSIYSFACELNEHIHNQKYFKALSSCYGSKIATYLSGDRNAGTFFHLNVFFDYLRMFRSDLDYYDSRKSRQML